MYGIEDAARTAQRGGVGIIAYYRKEGRALGEVTKFLVYNARKRQTGGDTAATYFKRTECVAGVEDARFQEFMPDCLHFFGITKIDHLHSMSNMKYNAITGSGIRVINRISIPEELIPADASVEMEAKKAAGYFTTEPKKTEDDLKKVKGRDIE
jgi:GTP cyclohydrolase II